MTENFPELMKDLNVNIQEMQQTPKKTNSERDTSRWMTIKCTEAKGTKWLVTYKGAQ